MADAPDIASLIHTTLLTAAASLALGGCSDDTTTDTTTSDGGCPPITAPFGTSDWNITPEQFTALGEYLAAQSLVWDELEDRQRCEFACLDATDQLEQYFSYSFYSYTFDTTDCTLTLTYDGDVFLSGSVSCQGERIGQPQCIGGRRPLGWVEQLARGSSRQPWLDGTASMEHVSITAFVELAAQLRTLGADEALIDRCLAAADDERRHVELIVSLGAAQPGELPSPSSECSRLAIALHNATEGCVTETWAALLARHQAEHASNEATRRVFATIAEDEARHAQLAWELHPWLCEGLTASERATVEHARADALARLDRLAIAQALMLPAALRRELGLPDAREAQALAQSFSRQLAAAA